jgi:serine/threonine-protein kinase RsbW
MSDQMHAHASMVKEITIGSNPDNLPLVEGFIDEIRSLLDFRDDVYGNVMVAITEAVNNGIHHGNGSDPDRKVFIRCESVNPYRIVVRVQDEGKGFDPDRLPDPTAPENLENPGGRGVFLMRHLSDDIEFENEGRTVKMFFNI